MEIWLQVIKVLVSVAMVLGLSLVAEHVSPRMAGLLSGYPLGTPITLAFIAIEISPGFAAHSAVYALAGFSATLALGCGYWLCGRSPGVRGIVLGTLGGLLAWFASILVLGQFTFSRFTGVAVTLVAIAVCLRGYRRIPEGQVVRGRFSVAALAWRAALAAAIILSITALAHLLPPSWAGLVASFPVTMYPFLVVLHLSYGPGPVATVIKHYPAGLGSLLCYALVVSFTYSRLGVTWGTILAFAAATLWILLFIRLQRWWCGRLSV